MLTILRDITQAVAQASGIEQALAELVTRTKCAMKAHCCSIYIKEQQQLVLYATDGLAPSAVGQVKMPLSEGLVGLVAERETLINLAEAHRHPRFKIFPLSEELRFQALLAVPIIYQKQTLGVLVVQQVEARQFSESEEAFLLTLAAQLAWIVERLQFQVLRHQQQNQALMYHGTTASSGISLGRGYVVGGTIQLEQPQQHSEDIVHESARLEAALLRSQNALIELQQRLQEDHEEVSQILQALSYLLDRQSLGGEYLAEVQAGWTAESAVSRVSQRYIAQLSLVGDIYLQARMRDIRELGLRVLRQLIEPEKTLFCYDQQVILVAKEIDTCVLAEFPKQNLVGVITELGGINSHASIVAKALGIPALVGVNNLSLAELDGKTLILNANLGQLLVDPKSSVIEEYQQLIASQALLQQQYLATLRLPRPLINGRQIKLQINAGLLSGIDQEFVQHTDGIGLYRSEIPFMLEHSFPSESAQIKTYRQILRAAAPKMVTMRTLDIGGDKTLTYFPVQEENPALGWCGIRFSLDHPEIFLQQIRAMLKSAIAERVQIAILLPMVSHLSEIKAARQYIDQAFDELNVLHYQMLNRPQIGVMLEVPSLLFQLPAIRQQVDFVSIGTNDLTQYLLAVDRNNPKVAALFDSYHPSVLQVLQQIQQQAAQLELSVSVCGEFAGDPLGALLLLAMGYHNLSMNSGSLAKINYLLHQVPDTLLPSFLEQALAQQDSEQVKQLGQALFKQLQLQELLD